MTWLLWPAILFLAGLVLVLGLALLDLRAELELERARMVRIVGILETLARAWKKVT